MTQEDFLKIKNNDIVHWKGDNPDTMDSERYNWIVIQIYKNKDGRNKTILIENNEMIPYFLNMGDACNQLQ